MASLGLVLFRVIPQQIKRVCNTNMLEICLFITFCISRLSFSGRCSVSTGACGADQLSLAALRADFYPHIYKILFVVLAKQHSDELIIIGSHNFCLCSAHWKGCRQNSSFSAQARKLYDDFGVAADAARLRMDA